MPNLLARFRSGRAAIPNRMSGAALAAGVALAPASALAAGLPQLDVSTYPRQIVWLAITFVILYVLMAKLALPRVTSILDARQAKINADLDRAAALRDEAAAVLASYEKALADARARAQALLSEASAEMSEAATLRLGRTASDIEARIAAAEARIAAAKNAALDELQTVATEVARDMAAKVAGVAVDAETAGTAVAAVLKEEV